MLRRHLLALLAAKVTAASLPQPVRHSPAHARFVRCVSGIAEHIAADRANPAIATTGLPRLYHHGRPMTNAVVLLHGFTNCPQQFDEFARLLFRRGCNVYVPRLPFHGYRDRLTMALEALTVGDVSSVTAEYFATAQELGARVSVLGLSLGGAMALDLAQNSDVDHAIAVAPFIMPIGVPSAVGLPVMQLLSNVPDFYIWWDPRAKEQCRPLYAYPGFPTHALATIVFFAEAVAKAARISPPRGRRCTLVTSSNESAVNNGVAYDVIDHWNRWGAGYAP